MMSAIQANSCKHFFKSEKKQKKKKAIWKSKKKALQKKSPKKKQKKKAIGKKGQKRRFEKAKKNKNKKEKNKKTSKNPGKQWNQQAMATRNARTNGKSAGDNGKRPAHSAGPDIPRRGSNLLADPTPGPGLGGPTPWLTLPRDLAFFLRFFCFFLGKKRKKSKKKAIWEDPPFQTRGSPQVSSHLHHLPGWGSQICKVPPKPSQSSCAQAPCHDPRHTLSSASSKSGMTFSAKATPHVFCCVLSNCFFCFFIAVLLLFYCFFVCLFFAFFCFFLIAFFLLFSKWLNRFFLFFF